ncbi:MAG: class I SAM-dependent methyltransferase [Solirubrobacteraceae bacterium]
MSLWGTIFAGLYDGVLRRSEQAGLAAQRAELLAGAHGEVLEIGAGTGLNLAHYGPSVSGLVMCEPEVPMARRLEARVRELKRHVRVVRAPAETLPFEDLSFDTVVCTLVLCSVADRAKTLKEVTRVLRPGGSLLFLEHVRSKEDDLARWQDRLAPLWRRVGQGCRCNSDTLALIADSELSLERCVPGRMPKALPILRPMISGAASK